MSATRDIQAVLREQVVPAGGTRHGLVVGIESYRDNRLNLRCAGADARAVYELMVDPECGMFPKENVRLLLDAEASKERIWRALSGLRRSAGENDTVWIYYAGHAAPEESNVYWVTYDSDVDDLFGTGLANDQIAKVVDAIRARQLLVLLDCCHAAATSMQKHPTRTTLTAEDLFAGYQGKGQITLSSSDGREKSVELTEVGHGAFTYFLQKGLRGEADRNGDGVISADELWEYLRHKVTDASQRAGNRQTPVLMGQMTHDLALTLNPAATRQKKRIAEAIEALIGLGEEKLTTEEASLCLEVLRRGPQSRGEEVIHAELERLTERTLRVATFKLAIQSALRTTPQREWLHIQCPQCGKTHRVAAGQVGGSEKCQRCGTSFETGVTSESARQKQDHAPDEAAIPLRGDQKSVFPFEGEDARHELKRLLGQAQMAVYECGLKLGGGIVALYVAGFVLLWASSGLSTAMIPAFILSIVVLAGLGVMVVVTQRRIVGKYREKITSLAKRAGVSDAELAKMIEEKRLKVFW